MRFTSIFLILITTTYLGGCISSPTRQTYIAELSRFKGDWLTIKEQAAKVHLKTLHTGNVQVPTGGVLDLDDPKTQTIKETSMIVEVYAHWVRHPVHGDFLIDTGLDHRFQNTERGSLKGLIAPWIVEDSFQREGQDIASQIKDNDIDVKAIFLTHIHGDHSAGIPAIKRHSPIIIGRGESLHYYPFIMYSDHFDEVQVIKELDFSAAQIIDPLGKAIDIFGDGSVWAIATPGHTRGNLSFLVNAHTGWTLLTGDASHTRWGFQNNVIPGWAEDEEQARQSLAMLRAFARQNPDVRVIYGHER